MSEAKTAILNNKTALGIEFGSTRIRDFKKDLQLGSIFYR